MAINDLITFRKGTSTQWTTVNPVLATGEPGFDITNNIIKIGDGATSWNNLSSLSIDLDTSLVAGTGISLSYDSANNNLSINITGNYASVNHVHNTSDITNFNSGVSGLLPTISNSGDNRVLTSTGSSIGINAETNLTFDGSLFSAPSGNFTNSLTVNGTGVSLSGHTHTASNITDFNSSVSGILTSFSGTISAPSGSFSTNLQIGSNNLTNTNTLNIINSSNLYLWSNFR